MAILSLGDEQTAGFEVYVLPSHSEDFSPSHTRLFSPNQHLQDKRILPCFSPSYNSLPLAFLQPPVSSLVRVFEFDLRQWVRNIKAPFVPSNFIKVMNNNELPLETCWFDLLQPLIPVLRPFARCRLNQLFFG